jgi:carboxymethylenebutenolidase
MIRQLLVASLLSLGLVTSAVAQPAVIPAGAEDAAKRLTDSPRHGEWVDVELPGSDVKIKSYVVYPERKDKAPVVIVIHEIFGMTDWVRAVADQLAAEGYIAIAPDLLSGKGPNGGGTDAFTGDKVREAIRTLTPAEVNARLDAVRAYALKLPAAGARSGVVGFCWGGTAVWNYAVHQKDLTAAVVYYGTGPKDASEYAKIAAPVVGFYGGDDARVNQTVPDSQKSMEAAGKAFTAHTYDGAGHGFLRQQSGREANAKAAKEAWAVTVAFLKERLVDAK